MEHGKYGSRLDDVKVKKEKKAVSLGPTVMLDQERCILCTRCVRICDELEGVHTWDLSGRGVETRVITDMATPWGDSVSCTSCGKCVQVCPTGALSRKGVSVSEMTKDKHKLEFLSEARHERVWDLRRLLPDDEQ